MSSGNVVRRASRFATDPRILHCGSQSSRQVVFLLSLPKSDRSIRAHLQIWDHSISTVSFIKAWIIVDLWRDPPRAEDLFLNGVE